MPLDYSRMHMRSYYIQYPPMYPNHASPQRPIVTRDNLVKRDLNCSKESEKNKKQDSKYLQLRWCPSGLSHTQKRRSQRLRKQETKEQQVEVEPTKSVAMKKNLETEINCFIINLKKSKTWPIIFYRP